MTTVDEDLALHNAINCKNIQVIRELITQGVNVNKKDPDGHTPLHLAAWNGMFDILKLFLCIYVSF